MTRRLPKWAVWLVVAAVAGLALLFVSVGLWGSWWRFPGMPTAEEWSAFFGAFAVIALVVAWQQLGQVDLSNRALVASNELARQVNLEAVRPRVVVMLEASRLVTRDRRSPTVGSLYVIVRNTGASPARNVRLSVDPQFDSLESSFKPGKMADHLKLVNEAFDGAVKFQTLNPGRSYVWFLGQVPALFDPTPEGFPRLWTVSVEYSSPVLNESFTDEFVLDLDVEKRMEVPLDPLVRIGKDIEVVGDALNAITRKIPRDQDVPRVTISLPRGRTRRRTPRWHRSRG